MGKSLKITQVKSESKLTPKQKLTVKSLGLRGLGSNVVRQDLRAIRGMLNKVHHIICAEQTDSSTVLSKNQKVKTYEIGSKKK